MRPIWKDGKLTVELHKPDQSILVKARRVGEALVAMNQRDGQALIDAVNAIMPPPGDTARERIPNEKATKTDLS